MSQLRWNIHLIFTFDLTYTIVKNQEEPTWWVRWDCTTFHWSGTYVEKWGRTPSPVKWSVHFGHICNCGIRNVLIIFKYVTTFMIFYVKQNKPYTLNLLRAQEIFSFRLYQTSSKDTYGFCYPNFCSFRNTPCHWLWNVDSSLRMMLTRKNVVHFLSYSTLLHRITNKWLYLHTNLL